MTELIRPAEAARRIGIDPKTLRRLEESGDLRPVMLGTQRRYRSDDVAAFLASLSPAEGQSTGPSATA